MDKVVVSLPCHHPNKPWYHCPLKLFQTSQNVLFPSGNSVKDIDVLPQRITFLIFSYLPYKFVRTTASLVCKAWRQLAYDKNLLRVTDSKYRESLDRFEKSKTLKLCLKNAFRELSSKMLFRFSKNSTPSRNSQKTKIHLFTSLNMQKISGKLTKFSVIALKQFTILEHGINLA